MEYKCKSVFGQELLRTLDVSGLGKAISIQANDQTDVFTVDIGPLEIPQYPVNDVLIKERVTICAEDDKLPEVICRDDFPIVPHLNVFEDGKKTLCLFDVSYEEIKYMFNASVFLRRIIYWFEQTARGTLHQPDQPLEPFFPGVRDGIIFDINNGLPFIKLQKIQTLHGMLYNEVKVDEPEGEVYTVPLIDIKKVFTENVIRKIPQSLGELDEAFGEQIEDRLCKLIPEIWRVRQDALYDTLFHQREKLLRRCKVLVVVRVFLAREKDVDWESTCVKVFQVADDFQRLFSAFGYRIENKKLKKKFDTTDYRSLKIRPFEFLVTFNPSFARQLNGDDALTKSRNFVQIGVGALGSQIANNCLRSGFGCWTYVDPDILYPHNLARHILNPDSIGKSKAQAMKQFADSLYSLEESIVQGYIEGNVFDKNEREKIEVAIQSADLIVDCSASVAVGRCISHELAGKTRAVSFFLNPTGAALVMLQESVDRQCSLDTLEMQYYRLLVHETTLNDHLRTAHRVLYSTTCRGTSMSYPQDNVAALSGFASKAIKHTQSIPEGSIRIWAFDDLELRNYHESGEIFEIITYGNWCIKVSPTLMDRLHIIRRRKLPKETGGVLIGAYDFSHKICYIVDAIDSPVDSLEYPNAYIRGSNGLLERVNQIEIITVGNLSYIGEWHSHPTNQTYASKDDQILLDSIAYYMMTRSSPACMIIVGESDYSVYLK